MRALLSLAMTAGLVAGCGMPAPNQSPTGPARLQAAEPQSNFSTKFWVRPFGRFWGGFYGPWIGAFGLPISSVYLFSPYFYRGFWGPRIGARWWW